MGYRKKEATHKQLDDKRIEYPTIDPLVTGTDYRYGYSVVIPNDHLNIKLPEYFAQSVQYDSKLNTSKIHEYGKGKYTGEVAFIPKRGKTSESEGYAISFVFNELLNKSEVVILDVSNYDKEPIATIPLPVRVPNGLHGNWIKI
ncbi:MAG: carotenoid oxygenase family protein [Cytophagales bacterium]|nr:carotenoid oxygenase family protein [Cytophagales bacterium]